MLTDRIILLCMEGGCRMFGGGYVTQPEGKAFRIFFIL